MSGQEPRIGPNMFLPRIQAPTFLKPRAAKSSSIPVVPPWAPNRVRWNVRVGTNHRCKSVPPTPSGFLMSWFGPAPYPSSEMVKPSTRTRVILCLPFRLTPNVMYTRREFNHGDDLLVGQMEPLHNLADRGLPTFKLSNTTETIRESAPCAF